MACGRKTTAGCGQVREGGFAKSPAGQASGPGWPKGRQNHRAARSLPRVGTSRDHAVVIGALEKDESAGKLSAIRIRRARGQLLCIPRPFAAFVSRRGGQPAENGHGCILVRRGMSSTKCRRHVNPAAHPALHGASSARRRFGKSALWRVNRVDRGRYQRRKCCRPSGPVTPFAMRTP